MKITKDTVFCISLAARPGNFGATVFNAAFEALSLDFFYKPLQLDEEKLGDAIKGVRALSIRGCSVSMPHKINVLKYLDELDPVVEKIGAANTIVNTDGVLKGYNTDYVGAKRAIEEKYGIAGKKVLIIGAGGVARALIVAALELNPNEIMLTNRHEEKGKELAEEFGLNYVSFKEMSACDLLINATSVGMAPDDQEMIVSEDYLSRCEAIMDVVNLPPETKLMKIAKEQGKIVIPGYEMTLNGAAAQFEMYTGQKAPLNVMRKIVLQN